MSLGKKREYCKALKRKLMKNPSSVYWEEVYFVCIPSYKEHFGHPVASQVSMCSYKLICSIVFLHYRIIKWSKILNGNKRSNTCIIKMFPDNVG